MSISAEYAESHKDSPAVLCCRAEEGVILSSHNLEDPEIFDELVDSGLLNLKGALKIGEVLGGKLLKTCDSLTPLTADLVERSAESFAEEKKEAEAPAAAEPAAAPAPVQGSAPLAAGGTLKIHIGEGKGIDIQIPMGIAAAAAPAAGRSAAAAGQALPALPQAEASEKEEDILVRSLTRKHFKITEVRRGPETKLEGTVLTIREGIEKEAVDSQDIVLDLKIDIITPDQYHTFSNTIMDVQPIAVKEGEDELGSGVTRVFDDVVMDG